MCQLPQLRANITSNITLPITKYLPVSVALENRKEILKFVLISASIGRIEVILRKSKRTS